MNRRSNSKLFVVPFIAILFSNFHISHCLASLSLEDTGPFKNLLNTADANKKCVERFSPASAHALTYYDVKSLYKSQADLERSTREGTPASQAIHLISLLFHQLGEEPPKLTKLDPVGEFTPADYLAIMETINTSGNLEQKQKSFCQNIQATLGDLNKLDTSISPDIELLYTEVPMARTFLAACRAHLTPPSPEPHTQCATCSREVGSPLAPGVRDEIRMAEESVARVADAPAPTAPAGTSLSFLKIKNIKDLIKYSKNRREATRSDQLRYKNKLNSVFTFLNTVMNSMDNPLTSRALTAIFLKKASRNTADIKKDHLAQLAATIDDSCLSPDGIQFKKDFKKLLSGAELSPTESERISRFNLAHFSMPAPPITEASLAEISDFGERLYVAEKHAVEDAPAPRRIIYRSYDDKHPPHSPTNFADCAETGFYDFVQTVFSKNKNSEFDMDALRAKSPALAEFLGGRTTRILSQEEYDDSLRKHWDEFIGNQATATPLISNHEAGGTKFEVQANLSNFFILAKHFFPSCAGMRDLPPSHVRGTPRGLTAAEIAARKEIVSHNFTTLTTCLSTAEKPIEVEAKHDLEWSEADLKSEGANIEIKVRGKSAMKMELSEFMNNFEGPWSRRGHFGLSENIKFTQFWDVN
jgi:hypothetical protein